ncbi:MAG: glycoside hydrolase family 16 protein [Acidimicrobiia bacterium]|nr:glycoside hydrolase family 16 protein [Acidimicrobiia bacterium]
MPTELDEAVIRFEAERWRPAGLASPLSRAAPAHPLRRRRWPVIAFWPRRPAGRGLALVALCALAAAGVLATRGDRTPDDVSATTDAELDGASVSGEQAGDRRTIGDRGGASSSAEDHNEVLSASAPEPDAMPPDDGERPSGPADGRSVAEPGGTSQASTPSMGSTRSVTAPIQPVESAPRAADADAPTLPTGLPLAGMSPTVSSPTAPAVAPPTPVPTTTTAPSAVSAVSPTPVPTTGAPSTTASMATPGGAVVWEDHFDVLDGSRWAVEHSTYGDGNNELQCYRPENVSVAGGRLVLRAVTETYTCPNGSTRTVTSGMVRSRGVRFGPGQALEVRVKLTPADPDRQGGLWPAVWSSGWAGGGWPRGGELDVLEVMTAVDPNRSMFSVHYARPDGSHGVTNRPVVGSEPFSAAWHTVRFEYHPGGRLVWFLDGQQVFAVTDLDTIQGYPAPFDQATTEIKINLALGGRPGPLHPAAIGTIGATFEIDYLRITQL